MAIWKFENYSPSIGEGTYVAETAYVIGDVTIGKNCYIGSGAVIRGDYGKIVIGDFCSIQENVVIHARPDEETTIGNYVTAGHGSVLHTCTIDDYAVIGIRAVVSDFSQLEEWAVIGENGLVRRGQKILKGEIAVGSPVRVIGMIDDKPKIKEELKVYKEKYIEMASRYLASGALERIG